MTHSVVKMCSSVQFLTAVHRHTYTHSICQRECERSVTFSMFALWNATFACGIHSTRERSFEEASGEMEVGRGLLVPEPCPLPPLAPRTRPQARKPNPNLKQRPPRALFCLKPDNNSCCYARYSCGNNCNVAVKLVQEYKFFLRILLPFYGNSLPQTIRFLGKWTVTRNAQHNQHN